MKDSHSRLVGLVVCLSVLAVLPAAHAAELAGAMAPSELFPWAVFNPDIPTQKEILGFDPGARPMTHGELMRYLEALSDRSPRARITTYARSHEGRRLVYLAVGDEATVCERQHEEYRLPDAPVPGLDAGGPVEDGCLEHQNENGQQQS